MREVRLTDKEKEIVRKLNHELYTVEYLEEWLSRNDNVFIDPMKALNTMAAHGYYTAVKKMIEQQ